MHFGAASLVGRYSTTQARSAQATTEQDTEEQQRSRQTAYKVMALFGPTEQ